MGEPWRGDVVGDYVPKARPRRSLRPGRRRRRRRQQEQEDEEEEQPREVNPINVQAWASDDECKQDSVNDDYEASTPWAAEWKDDAYSRQQAVHRQHVLLGAMVVREEEHVLEQLVAEFRRLHWMRQASAIVRVWRKHTFRLVYIRRQLVHGFLLKRSRPVFYSWLRVFRKDKLLNQVSVLYWTQKYRCFFRIWRITSRCLSARRRAMRTAFDAVVAYRGLMSRIVKKWGRTVFHWERLCAVRVIERNYRHYLFRRYFWAARYIRFWVMVHQPGLRLLKRRIRIEKARSRYERDTVQQMVDSATLALTTYLKTRVGAAAFELYIKKLTRHHKNAAVHRTATFGVRTPHSRDEVIDVMKPLRWRAKRVVFERAELEMGNFARRKFRNSSPPFMPCPRCSATFVLTVERRWHLFHECTREGEKDPNYYAWRECQTIIDESMAGLVSTLYNTLSSKTSSFAEARSSFHSFQDHDHQQRRHVTDDDDAADDDNQYFLEPVG